MTELCVLRESTKRQFTLIAVKTCRGSSTSYFKAGVNKSCSVHKPIEFSSDRKIKGRDLTHLKKILINLLIMANKPCQAKHFECSAIYLEQGVQPEAHRPKAETDVTLHFNPHPPPPPPKKKGLHF